MKKYLVALLAVMHPQPSEMTTRILKIQISRDVQTPNPALMTLF